MTNYCTYNDVVIMTGTVLPPAVVTGLIVQVTRRINSRLNARGCAPNYSSDDLIQAALSMTASKIVTRLRMDGTKLSSMTLISGVSLSDNLDNNIRQLEAEADELIENYIHAAQNSGGSQYERADRVDAGRNDYRLDQSDPVTFGNNTEDI